MNLNQAGISLIKSFESCRLYAYPDPATGGEPWTCGWGSTGIDIGPGTTWTQEQADQRLEMHLNEIGNEIKSLLHMDLTDNQFSAVVSLVYNIGIGNFKNSTLLKMINAGGITKAADQFLAWDHANGKVLDGLLRRRTAERQLYLT